MMILFLNLIPEGSRMNLGSVTKHVTTFFKESFLMKFSKYKGNSNS